MLTFETKSLPREMSTCMQLASYVGEGRIADFGFKNPRWVGGQLLKLNGKVKNTVELTYQTVVCLAGLMVWVFDEQGMGPYVTGGDLGFLYVGPEKSFMVVFNRLRLPE